MAQGIPVRLTAADARRFGLVVGAAFLALGALSWWRGRPLGAIVVGGGGVALVLAGLLVPGRLAPVQRAWLRLAVVLSRVTTPVLLGVVYYAVLSPMGLVMRLAGYRPLRRARSAASYWVTRGVGEQSSDMRRQF